MKIIDEYTQEEQEKIARIDAEYRPHLDATMARQTKLWEAFTAGDNSVEDELVAASKANQAVTEEWIDARARVTRQAETRLFDAYKHSANDILDLIKEEAPRHIAFIGGVAGVIESMRANDKLSESTKTHREQLNENLKKSLEDAIPLNEAMLKKYPNNAKIQEATEELQEFLESGAYDTPTSYDILFGDESLRTVLHDAFKKYLDVLERIAPETYQEAFAFIEDCIANKKSMVDFTVKKPKVDISVSTVVPKKHLTTTDKISGKAFGIENNMFYTQMEELIPVTVGHKGKKKEITTLLSLDFEKLEENGVVIDNKKLTPFDREVHDAITTLFIEGGNDVMSIDMIYRTMTGAGNTSVRAMPKQTEAITQSIAKMMKTLVAIDASKEAEAYGFDSLTYKGNLLNAGIITASLNGKVTDAVQVIKEPILFTYANRTNKIGRVSMKILDSPLNKNEETIILQGYLYRRILAMHHGQSTSIIYDTVYKYLALDAPNSNALKKKKSDIRTKIKALLEYWKKENFISGYTENKRGKEFCSVTLAIDYQKRAPNNGLYKRQRKSGAS